MQYNKANAVERMRELVAAQVPFVHQGQSMAGMDCITSLRYAFQYTGKIPPYPQDPVNGELERELRRIFGEPAFYRSNLLDPIAKDSDLAVGDVVSMQYRGPVRHAGLIGDYRPQAGRLTLLHTDAALGRLTEHILDLRWHRRIIGAWRP